MWVRLWFTVSLAGCGLCLVAQGAAAQEGPFAFQIRAGATFPVGGFRDEAEGWERSASAGGSMGMGFTFPVLGFIGGYLGFSQHRFGCDADVCPAGKDLVTTGFDIAARLAPRRGKVRPWIQGGFHSHRMEVRVRNGGEARRITSEGGGGYEVGVGILVQIGERTSLAPGVRYGLGNVPFDERPNLGLRFLVFDLGLVLGF